MEVPVIIKAIPPQIVNERASFGPLSMEDYIAAPDLSPLMFSAVLANGAALPKGMICTADGLITGIPGENTQGTYEVIVHAENEAGAMTANMTLTIKPNISSSAEVDYFDKLKAQVWEALDQKLPIPDFAELNDRPITPMEVYHLIERFGLIKIWDAFNLEPPGQKALLNLEGASKHYNVYDRGSCLVATPKELFSHERTLEDGLQTARAMAREVYNRNWTVELVGFHKLTRAAWVEIQCLSEINDNPLEVINFKATPDDLDLVDIQIQRIARDKTPGV